jgi:cation:H+ antiporter
MEYILFFVSFVMLFIGGDLLVRSSVSIALKMRISTLVVGMTVVSFATSAPELFVSVKSALLGITDITFGNIIGSNISNITLVLGLTAIVFRINISPKTKQFYFPTMLATSLLLGIVLYFFNEINLYIGLCFVALLVLFTFSLIKTSRKENSQNIQEEINSAAEMPTYKAVLFMIAGILLLSFGANFLIEGTTLIAQEFGFTERVISVSLVAIGTSIPELATSLVAAFKKEENLAVGNLIGSNIFNILAVLGITSIIKPISLSPINHEVVSFLNHPLFSDFCWMISITILLGIFIYVMTKNTINHFEGFFLFAVYIVFIYLLF